MDNTDADENPIVPEPKADDWMKYFSGADGDETIEVALAQAFAENYAHIGVIRRNRAKNRAFIITSDHEMVEVIGGGFALKDKKLIVRDNPDEYMALVGSSALSALY